MMFSSRLACACAAVVLNALPSAWAAPLAVLDRPAQLSQLARRTPLMAASLAGDRFVVVGPRGHVLLAETGGCQQVAVPTSADLTAVHFVSGSVGWAVGHGGMILHTRDGGQTWERQFDGREAARQMLAFYEEAVAGGDESLASFLDEARRLVEDGAGRPLLSVWFRDERDGFAVGAFNLILRTQDGGKSWQPWLHRTDNPEALHFTAVTGDATHVYVVGEQGLVLRLDEASERFMRMPSPYKGTFFGALIPQPGSVLVFGMRGSVYVSQDGGGQWERVESTDTSAITGGAVVRPGQVVLVTQSGKVLAHRAGQRRLDVVPSSTTMPLAGVAAAPDGTLALVGLGGVQVAPLGTMKEISK